MYSDVYVKCRKGAFDLIADLVRKGIAPRPSSVLCDGAEYLPEYTLVWNEIKWYNTDSGYESIMDALHDHDEDGEEYGYKFIRLGEETDDIEEETNDYDIEMYVVRDVDYGKATPVDI